MKKIHIDNRKGYIDIVTSWPIFSNLPLYIEIYRVGDNITANTLFKYNGRE